MNNILVVGYTYIKDSHRATFSFYPIRGKETLRALAASNGAGPQPENVFFLLPDIWKARFGKVIYRGPKAKNIFLTKTYFSHSLYPLIGGLLKGWMPNFPFVLLRIKRAHKIKLIYSCSEPILLTTLYNAFWSRMFGIKFVPYSWENLPYEAKRAAWFKKLILRLTLFFSDGLICGTKKSRLIHQLYIKNKPITVFPMNGLDPDFFKRQSGPKTFQGMNLEGKTIFSFAGAIDRRKGVHVIIDAFPLVLKELPSAHLIIVGSGDNDAVIQEKIEKYNLVGQITRIPWIEHSEVIKLFSISDVFLYPSVPYHGWEEQFGYAMAEASLTGLPIISTLSGSIEDVVKDGETGLLVLPNDFKALAKAMIRLGQDKELRIRLGQAGRDYTVSNLSHKVIAEKFHDFFESLI